MEVYEKRKVIRFELAGTTDALDALIGLSGRNRRPLNLYRFSQHGAFRYPSIHYPNPDPLTCESNYLHLLYIRYITNQTKPIKQANLLD